MVVVGTTIMVGILEAASGTVAIHQSPKQAYWLPLRFLSLEVVPQLVHFPSSHR